MKRWIALALVVFVTVVGAGGYLAMEAYAVVMTCFSNDAEPDERIDACTRMIEPGLMIGESVAFPLESRGDAYVSKGLYDLAIADYDEAIRLLPDFPSFFYSRGDAYLRKDLPDRAIVDFDEAIRLKPDFVWALQERGDTHLAHGRYEVAIADFGEAVRLRSDHSPGHNALAWILATAKDSRFRDGAQAIVHAEKAVALEDTPAFRDTLAAAFAEAGRFEDAVREQQKAIGMVRAAGGSTDDYVAELMERLNLYRAGKPYRE